MKKVFILLFCIFLVGCGGSSGFKELEDTPLISKQHDEYLSEFKKVIGSPSYHSISESKPIDIVYSYEDVSVAESYNENQSFDSLFIIYTTSDVKDFVKFVIEKNCNYDDVDKLLIKNEINGRYGKCMITHGITNDGKFSYFVGLM